MARVRGSGNPDRWTSQAEVNLFDGKNKKSRRDARGNGTGLVRFSWVAFGIMWTIRPTKMME